VQNITVTQNVKPDLVKLMIIVCMMMVMMMIIIGLIIIVIFAVLDMSYRH